MLPGAAQVGAEETRRRTRYAVLAGLNAEGYVPDHSEHMRLMRVRRCEGFADCGDKEGVGPFVQRSRPEAWMDLMLRSCKSRSARRGGIQEARDRHDRPGLRDIGVARGRRERPAPERRILSIDDTTIGRRWLSTLAMLLADVSPGGDGVRLRILTPMDPTRCRRLGRRSGRPAKGSRKLKTAGARRNFQRNWQTLANLRLISAEYDGVGRTAAQGSEAVFLSSCQARRRRRLHS